MDDRQPCERVNSRGALEHSVLVFILFLFLFKLVLVWRGRRNGAVYSGGMR